MAHHRSAALVGLLALVCFLTAAAEASNNNPNQTFPMNVNLDPGSHFLAIIQVLPDFHPPHSHHSDPNNHSSTDQAVVRNCTGTLLGRNAVLTSETCVPCANTTTNGTPTATYRLVVQHMVGLAGPKELGNYRTVARTVRALKCHVPEIDYASLQLVVLILDPLPDPQNHTKDNKNPNNTPIFDLATPLYLPSERKALSASLLKLTYSLENPYFPFPPTQVADHLQKVPLQYWTSYGNLSDPKDPRLILSNRWFPPLSWGLGPSADGSPVLALIDGAPEYSNLTNMTRFEAKDIYTTQLVGVLLLGSDGDGRAVIIPDPHNGWVTAKALTTGFKARLEAWLKEADEVGDGDDDDDEADGGPSPAPEPEPAPGPRPSPSNNGLSSAGMVLLALLVSTLSSAIVSVAILIWYQKKQMQQIGGFGRLN